LVVRSPPSRMCFLFGRATTWTMLPVQKRKAPPGSPPSAKNARTAAADVVATTTAEPRGRAGDRGKGAWRKPAASRTPSSTLTPASDTRDEGDSRDVRADATATAAAERGTRTGWAAEEEEDARVQLGTGREAGGSSPSDIPTETGSAEPMQPITLEAPDQERNHQLAGEADTERFASP